MKPYSLDMRQKSVNTYEAGNTSVRKVAERFLVRQKYGTGTTQTKKRDREITPLSGKRGKPSQLFGQSEQIKEMVVEHPDYTCFRIL